MALSDNIDAAGWYRPRHAAAAAGIEPQRVYGAIYRGELEATRRGENVVVLGSDLLGWLQRSTRRTKTPS